MADPRRAVGGGGGGVRMMNPMGQHKRDALTTMEDSEIDMMSDDDNAAPDMTDEGEDHAVETEDALLVALDDLEGRVVSALDDFKLHPGVRSSPETNLFEELATLLQPVLEIAAHTGPAVARTYASYRVQLTDQSCEEAYQRLNSDLILPVVLELAQSDTIPAKRAASLECFHKLWKAYHTAGSWLDQTTAGPQAGPHGSGGAQLDTSGLVLTAMVTTRREARRMAREGELLRYWVTASIACTLPGAFSNEVAEGAVASRGTIAASASLRPALRHIAQRIRDTDDRGAGRLYVPTMKMVEGVLRKLLLQTTDSAEASRSACIKFLEIVATCCSSKVLSGEASSRRRTQTVRRSSIIYLSMLMLE
jgi:symplekin